MRPLPLEPCKEIPSFCFESPHLKPLSFKMESVEVTTRERRIRATWTPELAQDLQGYHGINAEDELIGLLNEELTRELDRNTINTIAQDLVPVQPMGIPEVRLFYFEPQLAAIEHPTVYDDGSWSLGNTFESIIGIKMELKDFTLT